MTSELLKKEQERFNSLSKEEASRIIDEVEGSPPVMRSCWYCNGAHDHLKSVDCLLCFACGIEYARGFPVRILGLRMNDEPITDQVMQEFAAALEEQ